MLMGGPAWGQSCTFTNTGLNWGSINLALGTPFDLNGTFSATCTGTPGQTVRICPNFNAGTGGVNGTGSERYMLNGANQLRYNIYQNAARTTVWGSRTWGLPPTPPTINLALGGTGTATTSRTMFGRVLSAQTALPAGTYTSVFSGAHTQIAYAYSFFGSCSAIGLANVTNVPFTAQADYPATCSVSATNLDFGSHGILDTAVDATNTVSVTCSNTTPYTVSMNGGNAGATDPTQRKMANGAATVTYGIYRDAARALPWGSTIGTDTVAGTGTGAVQTYTGYGRVPAQTTPSAQTYTDTIVVTVTY
ncbi:MAG: Csu type fimbrial protein [Aestuariivirga sp.]